MSDKENNAADDFDTLWAYCTAESRVVPKDWNKLYGLLKNKKQKASGGWIPPLPLILAAWHCTSPLEKQLRFKEHIQWACHHDQAIQIAHYLQSLPENEWFHLGEL